MSLTRLGKGDVFRVGDGVAEFAFIIDQGDENLVWCSCPDFRLDDACEHVDALMKLED